MNLKKIKIILSIPLALFFIANLFSFPISVKADDSMPNWEMPDLQIKIPGLEFTSTSTILANCGKDEKGKISSCEFPWIGEYIAGVYKYAIGIVGILAAVLLMFGGVLWLTAGGNTTRLGEAKAWISASLSGLIIALCSYTILYQVNPDLLKFKPLTIGMVQKIEIEGDSKLPLTVDQLNTCESLITKSDNIREAYKSSLGKFTYDQNRRCSSVNGINYIDCSSYACVLLEKSGYSCPGNTTSIIFRGQPKQNPKELTEFLDSLPAGTLVGWPPTAQKNGYGHVYISLGNGIFAQSRGGKIGREKGKSVNSVIASDIKTTMEKYGVSGPYIVYTQKK
ncbi:MAG: pilin [Patescibacteria group bacterium]